MPNPADELYEIYNLQSNTKEVVLELDFEPKPPSGITALAIQRAGVGRSYTATFELHDLEALVFYAGEGEGRSKLRLWQTVTMPMQHFPTPQARFSMPGS